MSTLRDFADEIKVVREKMETQRGGLQYKIQKIEKTREDQKVIGRLGETIHHLEDAEECLRGE